MAKTVTNISLIAVPAYWVLCMIPHFYAIHMMRKANNGIWDNTSPRSTNWDAKLKGSTPAEIFTKYERAEAAHKNGFENLPIFVGAVLAGNIAKLGNTLMNSFVGVYLGTRVLYTFVYILVRSNRYSFSRTLIWFVGVLLCMVIYVKSGVDLN